LDTSKPDEGLEIGSVVQPVTWSGNTFGIHATESFEPTPERPDGWQSRLLAQWDTTDNFSNELQRSATLWFYFDLWNKKDYWGKYHDSGPYGLEAVDLFLTDTHGDTTTTDSRWAMWNRDSLAESGDMRLGECLSGRPGLSIFATIACKTLQWNSYTVARWEPVFMGGLRIALGSHDAIKNVSGGGTEWIAAQFAVRLHQNWSIKAAWISGLSSSSYDNDSAALVTGTDSADCLDRLRHMTWYNFKTYDRRGDAARQAPGIVNHWCIAYRTNG
ncbi:MAG: hypothetical protein JW940_37385, partial [Polyangiaceae bacterium]|nr:hypothetical protein [Polyangiaceae bacterium]